VNNSTRATTYLLTWLLLVSCILVAPPTPLPTVPPTVFPSASPTALPTPSAIVTQAQGLRIKCVEIASSNSQDLMGMVVLSGRDYHSPSYLMEVNNGHKLQLPQKDTEALTSLAVSPDGEWLAYLEYYPAQPAVLPLFFAQSDGKPRYTLTWNKPGTGIVGWLDNKRLLISHSQGKIDDLDSLIVLDPFTNKQQELFPDYPDIYESYPLEEPWGPTVYDSTLTRVVYGRATSEGRFPTVLWNRETKQDIVLLEGRPIYRIPEWSPDGQQFAVIKSKSGSEDPISVDQEIFTVSRDGDIKQLTHLTDSYSKVELASSSWSPDGRYIAFWLVIAPVSYPDLYPDAPANFPLARLAVVDTVTQEITDYCISGSAHRPIWSPDGRALLIGNAYDNSSSPKSHVYIVDLVQSLAFHIADNMEPVGWMKSSP